MNPASGVNSRARKAWLKEKSTAAGAELQKDAPQIGVKVHAANYVSLMSQSTQSRLLDLLKTSSVIDARCCKS